MFPPFYFTYTAHITLNNKKAIEHCQWNTVLARIQIAPNEATHVYEITSEGGIMGLPLHLACMKKPPVVIVSSLITVYPVGASTKLANNLALHYALKNGAAPGVIETLIISYPEGLDEKDAEGNKPNEIFKNHKSAWDEETYFLIKEIIDSGLADLALDKHDSKSQAENRALIESSREADDEKKILIPELEEEDWKTVRFCVYCRPHSFLCSRCIYKYASLFISLPHYLLGWSDRNCYRSIR